MYEARALFYFNVSCAVVAFVFLVYDIYNNKPEVAIFQAFIIGIQMFIAGINRMHSNWNTSY